MRDAVKPVFIPTLQNRGLKAADGGGRDFARRARRKEASGFSPRGFILAFVIFSVLGCGQIDKPVSVSSSYPAHGFKLSALDGKQFSLSDYKDKRAVMLIFWTTWCPYCRVAFSELKNEAEAIKALGVEVLAINVGEPKGLVAAYMNKFGLDFNTLLDTDSSVARDYGIMGVPSYFVIDKNGRIAFNGVSITLEQLKELAAK